MKMSGPPFPEARLAQPQPSRRAVGSSGGQPPFGSHLRATGSHLVHINAGVIPGAHASPRYPYPGSFQGLLNVPLMFIVSRGLLLGNSQTENRVDGNRMWLELQVPVNGVELAPLDQAGPPPPPLQGAAPSGLWPQSAHPQKWLSWCLPELP